MKATGRRAKPLAKLVSDFIDQGPFIPRSLVGMTQGARKRKARDDKELSEFLVATLAKLEHTEERAKYRIGQKLRPCPGCCACSPCNVSRIHLVRLCTSAYPRTICDGSGVLPARKKGSKP